MAHSARNAIGPPQFWQLVIVQEYRSRKWLRAWISFLSSSRGTGNEVSLGLRRADSRVGRKGEREITANPPCSENPPWPRCRRGSGWAREPVLEPEITGGRTADVDPRGCGIVGE